PTVEVELPKLTEPEAQNLQEEEVVQIYQAVAGSSLPERNMALISVLLHGLRAEEVCALNIEDYDGRRLHIREAKADSKGFVPLTTQAKQDLEQDLQWRQEQGRVGQRFVRNCITTALKALLYRLSIVSKNAFQINLKKCNLYLKGKQCKELNSTLWTKFGLREKLILVVHCKILCFFLT
ncbi:MAG TPA: tyrosine-type recombinase/integrase, partial [Allocoleopsis sp.]